MMMQSNQHLTSYMTPSNNFGTSDPSGGSHSGPILMNVQEDSNRSSVHPPAYAQVHHPANPYSQATPQPAVLIQQQKPYEESTVKSSLLGSKVKVNSILKNGSNTLSKHEKSVELEGAMTSSEQDDDFGKFQMQP